MQETSQYIETVPLRLRRPDEPGVGWILGVKEQG